jgi:hypothetical protein
MVDAGKGAMAPVAAGRSATAGCCAAAAGAAGEDVLVGGDGFGDEEMMCAGGGVKMEKIGWAWGADARRVRQIHGESGNKFLSSLHTF